MDIEDRRNDLEFEHEKAFGSFWAALCLNDLIRTRLFILGLNKAV